MRVIQAQNLSKAFGSIPALRDVSFDVDRYETVGLIGPSGSGKTTLMQLLLGFTKGDSGKVQLFSGNPWRDYVDLHKHLAYVPADVSLWPNLTGDEVIDLFIGIRGKSYRDRRSELIELFGLDTSKKCRTYSEGNRKKIALVSAFLSDVELYLFDEPEKGLDDNMQQQMEQCIRHAANCGKTIFLTTQNPSVITELCDKAYVINQGRIIDSGNVLDLKVFYGTNVTVETDYMIEGLSSIPGIYDVNRNGIKTSFVADPQALNDIMKFLPRFNIRSLECSAPSIEQIILRRPK